MEKYVNHEEKPKRPIGQKHRPMRSTEYEPGQDVLLHLKRMGYKDMML